MSNNQIAKTIISQLGNKALYMIGAKNIGASENNVSFKIGRNTMKVSHIKITLNSMDTYDVEYINIRGIKIKTISEDKGIYNDMLHKSIERNTGLCISL